jgi:hypothetical protein
MVFRYQEHNLLFCCQSPPDVKDQMFKETEAIMIYLTSIEIYICSSSRRNLCSDRSEFALFTGFVVDEQEGQEDNECPDPVQSTGVL